MRAGSWPRRSAVVAALVAATLVASGTIGLSACGAAASTSTTTSSSTTGTTDASTSGGASSSRSSSAAWPALAQGTTTHWVVPYGVVAELVAARLPMNLLNADFNTPTAFLVSAHGTTDPVVPRAAATVDFTSAAQLVAALRAGQVPTTAHWLLLDIEAWSQTPSSEQHDPIGALRTAVAAAHRAGKQIIFAPGVDLVSVLRPNAPRAQRFALFDELVVAPAARLTDVFLVQAQSTEATPQVTTFITGAVGAARTARPGIVVFGDLSTNPDGRRVNPADLMTLYRAGHAAGVTGWWLSIPSGGTACPACGQPQPQVAVAFLEQLAKQNG
jgi:hypothetical protein